MLHARKPPRWVYFDPLFERVYLARPKGVVMSLIDKFKRLKVIVWDESGIPKFWALVSPFIPGAIQLAKNTWPDHVRRVEAMLDLVQWWWGIPIAAGWVIWALARKIFEYETPSIEGPNFYKHEDDWYMEMRGKGIDKFHVAINFEIYKEDGTMFRPDMFGFLWNQTRANPIGIHGGGNSRTVFARYSGGVARLYGTDAAARGVIIELPKGSYRVDLDVHVAGKAGMHRKVNVLNDGAAVHVS